MESKTTAMKLDRVAPREAPPARSAVLRVVGARKSFGPTQALRDGSLELYPGEIHSLVGENGSGKSTLVKILSGVYAPDEGLIEFEGREIRAFAPRSLRRQAASSPCSRKFSRWKLALSSTMSGSASMVSGARRCASRRSAVLPLTHSSNCSGMRRR